MPAAMGLPHLGIAAPVGIGKAAVASAVFAGSRHGIVPRDDLLPNRRLHVGAVTAELPTVAPHLARFDSRSAAPEQLGFIGAPARGHRTKPQPRISISLVPREQCFMLHRREEPSKLGSGLRRKAYIAHEQRIDASLAERGDRVGRRADNRLAVIERGVENERHAGLIEKS